MFKYSRSPAARPAPVDPLFSSSWWAAPFPPLWRGESVLTMLRRLSRRVLRAASREVSASPSAPALVASLPWLAPWRVASLSTSARAGARGTRESTAADEAERRKRQRRAARRADRQHLRAWASDDARWDEPHLGAPRRPSSGARRRRVVHWADEVSADARANEAFAREACEMGWSGTGTRGGPKGGGTARVKYKHRNERDTRRRRGTGGESPRDSRQERLDRQRDRAHARDEPFFREDAWWYEENGGTRRTDARATGKRAARRAAREAAEAAEAEEFWRRFEERVFQERLRAAFPRPRSRRLRLQSRGISRVRVLLHPSRPSERGESFDGDAGPGEHGVVRALRGVGYRARNEPRRQDTQSFAPRVREALAPGRARLGGR